MNHQELVKIAEAWLYRQRFGVVLSELKVKGCSEIPDCIGYKLMGNHTILIECKVKRKDLFRDRQKIFRKDPSKGVGDFRYYLCPPGVITIKDLGAGNWGLLYGYSSGMVRIIRKAKAFPHVNIEVERALLYTALRRLCLRGRLSEIYDNSQVTCINGVNCKSKFVYSK